MDVNVLFLVIAEQCDDIPQKFYKKIFKRSNSVLLQSSKRSIQQNKHDSRIKEELDRVDQVISDKLGVEMANDLFPYASPDVIKMNSVSVFVRKMVRVVHSPNIAVIVTQNQLKMFTGIKGKFEGMYKIQYHKDGNSFVEKHDAEVIYIGRDEYHTKEDESTCRSKRNIDPHKVEGVYSCWLGDMPDDTPLLTLRIPACHNCATGYQQRYDSSTSRLQQFKYIPKVVTDAIGGINSVFKWTQNQVLTIEEQLLAGVRSFDLRVWCEKEQTIFNHGARLIQHDFFETVRNMSKFLQDNPGEFIYVLMKISGPGNHDTAWEKYNQIMTSSIHNVDAGKMVLGDVRGAAITYCLPYTEDIVSYFKTFDGANCTGERNTICRSWKDLEEKYIDCFPLKTEAGKVYVTQLHAQVDYKTVKENEGSGGILTLSSNVNAHLLQWFRKNDGQKSRHMNIIEIDYYKPNFTKVFINVLNKRPHSDGRTSAMVK